jgi:hypothetical protein
LTCSLCGETLKSEDRDHSPHSGLDVEPCGCVRKKISELEAIVKADCRAHQAFLDATQAGREFCDKLEAQYKAKLDALERALKYTDARHAELKEQVTCDLCGELLTKADCYICDGNQDVADEWKRDKEKPCQA